MKRSHDRVAAQGNCEGWLSTRNRKKTCPPATKRTSFARKLPSFSFKLTQDSLASQQQNMHQSSILNFIKKRQIQEKQNLGAVNKLFDGKDVLSDLQNKNTDFGHCPQESTAGIPSSNGEYKCQLPLQPMDEESLKLEGFFEKIVEKGFHKKTSCYLRENVFSVDDIGVGMNKMSSSKTSYFSENDNLSCFDWQKNSIINTFESQENSNPQKKPATTPLKYIKPINQDLPGSQKVSPTTTGLKCLKYSLDYNDAVSDLYADNLKKISAIYPEIYRHDSDSPPYKKRQFSRSSTDKILLKRKQYLKRNMVNVGSPNESLGNSNPVVDVKYREKIFSNSSCDKNDLLVKKAACDSLTYFPESDCDLSLPMHSENSEESPKKEVSCIFQSNQISGNYLNPQYEEMIEDNANSNPSDLQKKPLNRYIFSEHDFESVVESFANTSHLSDDGLFENSNSQQDIDEHLNLEEDNPEFTLQTQRSIDPEIPLEFMQETEDFTFNADLRSEGTSQCDID